MYILAKFNTVLFQGLENLFHNAMLFQYILQYRVGTL